MTRLSGRVAIVTGGAQGIGLGVARAFASEGAHVVIASRHAERGEEAARSIAADFAAVKGSASHCVADVSIEDSVRALVAQVVSTHGRLDVLVNNATPTGGTARLEHMKQSAIEEHVRVNYYAAFWSMQAAFPVMKAAGHGRIINMASLNGINAHVYTAMYNASKEALRALTRTAAAEWGPYGITCNVICPAATSEAWRGFSKFDPEGAARILASNPSRRMGDPEADIGPLAVFLASEASRYVTGNTIHADGGGHINGVPWRLDLPE
jgi:NAD(P)-dependent dehydrogenase (short-subunit alcohol dehydrogenase family)